MTKRITKAEIEKLYEEWKTPEHVRAHCRAVAEVASKLGRKLNERGYTLDIELIYGSGLIHDVARTIENHADAGAEILERLGYADEAAIVRVHMTYPKFNPVEEIDECDLVCLADRLVKEDKYVGLDERIEYILNKAPNNEEIKEHILQSKERTRKFIEDIEKVIEENMDELFTIQENEQNLAEREKLPNTGRKSSGAERLSNREHGIAAAEELHDREHGIAAKAAPADLDRGKLDELLKRVEKPGRYIGGEVNSVRKDEKDVKARFAFAFPDLYEIGMSYLGMQILYNAVNKEDGLYCERVFAPAPDMEELMKKEGLPLFTLETKTPLKNADMVGFTLQYEMSFTTILDMLKLAHIPLLSEERDGWEWPIVAAGGPCSFNPEPLADFIDIFLIGDGELLLPQVLKLQSECREAGFSRKGFLEKACKLEGVYVPSFYKARYNDDGTVKELCKLNKAAPDVIRKSMLPSIEETEFPIKPVIPMVEAVHDRAVTETFRGCTRGCRFCQAGMIYRPVRERSKEKIWELSRQQIEATGNDELSLLSLSTSDHSEFQELTLKLMEYCKENNVSLSLPSLRIDKFAFDVLSKIQEYKKSGLTYAPEAGTQRLRDVINKGVTEEDILTSVEQAISLGWRHIKLYFMIGLPTETYEDLDGIADIARKIIDINHKYNGPKGGRFRLTVSVSNFVPKADTPFQWERQNTPEEFKEKHCYLEKQLKIKGVTFNYHDSFTSVCEAVFARGDRRCGKALLEAYKLGCRLDGWSEHFEPEKWEKAFELSGVSPEFYAFRERDVDETLPWEHIDCGVSKAFFLREREKAYGEITTADCRRGCAGCGINKRVKCELEGIYG